MTELADILGLTKAYSNALVPTRTRHSAHDPGRVLSDLVADGGGCVADGGDCVADLNAMVRRPCRLASRCPFCSDSSGDTQRVR